MTKFLGPLDIAVVGCGVAGQAAATLLAERGHRVTIYEKFTEPQPVGAGLLLQPTGLAVLRQLGLADAAIAGGARVAGLEARTDRGRSILDLRYADLHPLAHGVGIHRATLFDLLHGRLLKSPAKLVTGAEIVDVDKTHLVEENGARHGPFDLIVAADGVHSGLRARLLPHVRAPLYHWGCMWTTVPDLAGIGAAGVLRQRVRGTKLMMGLLPVGRNEVTIYWSLPIRALGRSKKIDLAAWRRTAMALWPEAGAIIDRAAAGDFARATYRHVALSHWNAGPVLFIGDAAHGTSPQLGQGANLGLMDAWVLAKTLDDAPELLIRLPALRAAPRPVRALLPPRQPSADAVLPVAAGAARLAARRLHGAGASRAAACAAMMGSTLAGTRRGWFSATPLGDDGCFPLDA